MGFSQCLAAVRRMGPLGEQGGSREASEELRAGVRAEGFGGSSGGDKEMDGLSVYCENRAKQAPRLTPKSLM